MSDKERRVLELWDAPNGLKAWHIAAEVYGQGGYQTERVREILRKYGRV